MAAKTEVKIFTMIARYNGVVEFGIKFYLFHCGSVFLLDITQNSEKYF